MAADSQPTSLLTCPLEILRDILKHLSRPDLYSLCLVCKSLPQHAEPLLYSEIDFVWLDDVPPITSLLRTLFARPELAAYVKDVKLGGSFRQRKWDGKDWIRRFPSRKIPVADVEGPIAFVEALNLPDDGFWVQELRAGTMDAFVAVLLAQVPNVRSLYMCGNFARETILLGILFWSALCEDVDRGLPKFRFLEEVSIDKEWLDGHTLKSNTHDLLSLFYLPAAKRMMLWLGNPEEDTLPWPKEPPQTTLRSLELYDLREPCLGSVLAATPCLEVLKWEWWHQVGRHRTLPAIDLDLISVTLPETLTDLVITAETDADEQNPDVRIWGVLDLRRLTALKRVHLPLQFISASMKSATARPWVECLPPNLERLTVQTWIVYQEHVDDWAGPALVDAVRAWLPWATPGCVLDLIVNFDYWDWTVAMRDEVIEAGAKAGVPVKVTESDELLANRARFTDRQT